MIEILEGFAARAADQSRVAQWAARSGIEFALAKRQVDAQHALAYVQGHVKTELVNALRGVGQQLRP